uniref:APO domain-containing protein n=1 Tax=Solanum lycopersicum TaxID=4081 RepID=A0A3Q7GN12_SOLLC
MLQILLKMAQVHVLRLPVQIMVIGKRHYGRSTNFIFLGSSTVIGIRYRCLSTLLLIVCRNSGLTVCVLKAEVGCMWKLYLSSVDFSAPFLCQLSYYYLPAVNAHKSILLKMFMRFRIETNNSRRSFHSCKKRSIDDVLIPIESCHMYDLSGTRIKHETELQQM